MPALRRALGLNARLLSISKETERKGSSFPLIVSPQRLMVNSPYKVVFLYVFACTYIHIHILRHMFEESDNIKGWRVLDITRAS